MRALDLVRVGVVTVVTALAPLLAGCKPSEGECERLLDHFLDVEATAATEGHFREMPDGVKASLENQKLEFRASLKGTFIGKCREKLSSSEVACALAATDQASMDKCEGH